MKLLLLLLAVYMFTGPSFGAGSAPYYNSKDYKPPEVMIDNFEDGNFVKEPEWWFFGNAQLKAIRDPAIGIYSLSIKGTARDWYVGGIGVYFADPERDLSKFSKLEMDVYGSGEKSGTLKIELYEDDNGNFQVEQDQAKGYVPLFDDRFAYELKVNWKGWKHVSIPFADFIDTNAEAGDNVFNPAMSGKSGGLLQLQFIALAASKTGRVDFAIDNIGFNK